MKATLIFFLLLSPLPSSAKTWLVGATRQYKVPSAVASLVSNGDTVLVDSGSYTGDVSVWNASNLVLRCPDGMARFDANGNIAQQKGIFVIYGDNDYMEGFKLFGAAISEANGDNGAGIRMQGHGFTVRRCYIHDNQDGILTGIGSDTTNNILIEACEFYHNGVESGSAAGYEHNIYIGHCASLTVKFCYFHGSVQGHELKTRASRNYILYNKIVDGQTGDGSFSIDIPNGGLSYVIGNAIEKGPMNVNHTVTIDYGGEGIINGDSEFYFVNNTVVTDRAATTLFHLQPGATALIANNIFAGQISGFANSDATTPDTEANVESLDTAFFHFRNVIGYDYYPVSNFPGLRSAILMATNGVLPVPLVEYVDPLDSAARPWENQVGAFNEIGGAGVANIVPSCPQLANYPNPFSRETTLEGPSGRLALFDASGNRQTIAYHQTQDGLVLERGSLPAGIYFYGITSLSGGTIAKGSLVIRN